jgi:hypothetical protein
MKKLIELIIEKNIKTISIIGLAKNAGKTVTFNTIVKEATERNIRLALVSYGRDGEDIDILNRHEKPRIYVPPATIFVTTNQALQKSSLNALVISNTGINTTLGEVNIYRSIDGGNVELVGIHSLSGLKKVKELIANQVELVLVDGALDRRSSAIPELSDAMILATGAVIGNSEELVVKRTIAEINKLNLPEIEDINIKNIINNSGSEKGGIIEGDGIRDFVSETSFDIVNELKASCNLNGETIYLNGALTDSFVEGLCYSLVAKDLRIIVQNATKVFLNQRSMSLLKKHDIKLYVLEGMNLPAVTVNPVSPYGVKLDSDTLIRLLKEKLDVPVYDLMSKDYQ